MKRNIKRIILLFVIVFLFNGCTKEESANIKVDNVSDYVVQVPTYTDVDDEYAISYTNNLIDGWNNTDVTDKIITEGGCTAFMKTLENGDTVMSRNMDLNITTTPEYIFYINEEGKNKSFNIANVYQLSEEYNKVLKDGISEDLYKILPYLITDSFNEYGLVLENNMRSDEYYLATGELLYSVSSTNPNAETRVSITGAIRYLSDHAKTVEEALKLLGATNYNTNEKYSEGVLDVYAMNTKNQKWNYAVGIADATGEYGVIEFVDNSILYYPYQKYQANYYIGKDYREQEKYPQGEARTAYIESQYNSIKNIYDMMSVLNDIRYSYVYRNDSKFDITSEYAGMDVFSTIDTLEKYASVYGYTVPDYSNLKQTFYNLDTSSYVVLTKDNYKDYPNRYNLWSTSYVLNNKINSETKAFIEWYSNFYNSLTESQRRNLGIFWNSAHSVTYNCTKKYAIVTFYEDDSTTKIYSFENLYN